MARIGLHILFWAVYLPLNAVLTCIMYRLPLEKYFQQVLLGETFTMPIKIGLTYFVFYYVIPLYMERQKLGKMLFYLMLAFAVSMLGYRLSLGIFYFQIFPRKDPYIYFDLRGLLLTAFDIFITLAAACTIKFIRLHYKSLEFEQQLIREKLESELNFLRAQTNPHFLFNTLNNLYVLARKKSDQTADAIMMLSKIMRFVLYECRAPFIALSQESKVIQDYIELEKLRYNERLSVRYTENLANPDAQIAPLLLLPFVENSFKHGASGAIGEVLIEIELSLAAHQLHFWVRNTVDDSDAPTDQGGIGLMNVRRQLELLYPDRYRLVTARQNGHFVADLTLELG